MATKSPNIIHILQAQAFIEAAEDIVVEDDVINDLRAGLEDFLDINGELRLDAEEALKIDEDDGLDDPVYNALVDEADKAWSKQEVRAIKHYLKEKGMQAFIAKYVTARQIPIPTLLYAFDVVLCSQLRLKRSGTMAFFLEVAMSRELHRREKLPNYNSIKDAVQLIGSAKNILILTGAGISVSCGIPDFRSRNGLYAQLKEKNEYDLDDPQQMFDLNYFKENPSVFYSFAAQIYPSNFVPSPCHRFIKAVEDRGKLLRNYTQNIDTLEQATGITRVLQCHGSFATASCLQCRTRTPIAAIEADILARRVPLCNQCNKPAPVPKRRNKGRSKDGWGPTDEDNPVGSNGYPPGIMKPDITFFGEKLADAFDNALKDDREKVDLLLVIGTSLKVAPVADILLHLPHSVPQILINKTPISHMSPDIALLGNADVVVEHLCRKLGWDLPPLPETLPAHEKRRKRSLPSRGRTPPASIPQQVANSHVWLFEGAEGGSFVEEIEALAEGRMSSKTHSPIETTPEPERVTARSSKRRRIESR